MPTAQALRLCPEARVVRVPRKACASKSRDIRLQLQRLSPVVQAASIDEFYLDVTGTERLFRESLEGTAERIRATVLESTEVSVSIGGGTRRMIAKLASQFAKPAGVHIVPPGEEANFMRRLELADIPGVGPALVHALRRRGLVHIEDALAVDQEWLERWFGTHRGRWLYRRMRGLDASRVDQRERRKSISSERTFSRDLDSDEALERSLLQLSTSVGRTLRKAGLRTRTIAVKVRDSDFKTRSRARTTPQPLETDGTLFTLARELLRELRSVRRTPVRLLGVGLTNFTSGTDPEQLGMFDDDDQRLETERGRTLGRAVDSLRERFGDHSIVPGPMIGD